MACPSPRAPNRVTSKTRPALGPVTGPGGAAPADPARTSGRAAPAAPAAPQVTMRRRLTDPATAVSLRGGDRLTLGRREIGCQRRGLVPDRPNGLKILSDIRWVTGPS